MSALLPKQKFGRWTPLAIFEQTDQSRGTRWLCVCDCGTVRAIFTNNLRRKMSKSCGCGGNKGNLRHGDAKTGHLRAEYTAWAAMHDRCYNQNRIGYELYGARGISVCERWINYKNFIVDMGYKPSPSHSLDRINNDGNYEPGNCRWATAKQQANNRRVCKRTK